MLNNYQPPIRTGLLDFFRNSAGCQFVIPVYQRNYTWTSGKEVKQYLEDLKSVLSGEYTNHFLGIMIYLDTPLDFSTREFSVIDGQQRLTTTFLTLYAIKDLFRQQEQFDQISNLEGQYLTNPFASEKVKYKLKPLVSDDKVYRYIVEDKVDKISNKRSNVYKNYNYIRDYIEKLLASGIALNDILMAMNKLYVVCVPIAESDNAQKIFESINATGVKLTASDLIRNFILMDLDSETQEKYYSNYWREIEKYISNDSKKLELFFRLFLSVKNFSLPNKNDVYRAFVTWYKDSDKTKEDVLKDVLKYANSYFDIYKQNIDKLDYKLTKSIREYRRLSTDLPAPLLMELYLIYQNNELSADKLSQIFDIINSYLMRRNLCNLDSNSITRMFPTILKELLESCKGNYSNLVEILKKYLIVKNIGNGMFMPTDSQMREMVYSANMYNLRSTLKIVFDKIEHINNPAPVDTSFLSVEHLMPQTPSKEWLSSLNIDLETYQLNLHRLGNLTLAAKQDNSIMGNKPWQYKTEVLSSTSHLKINEKILKIEKWDINEIEKRTIELIDLINTIYPYPKIEADIIDRLEIFIINNDNIISKAYFSLDDGSVEIDIGSILMPYENIGNYPDVEDLRQELISDGIIEEIDGKLQFVKPYMIYSKISNNTALSSAANLILHGSRNGWTCWVDSSRISLKDIAKIRDRFS